ncbi:MAG: phage head morphogenesis protein [Clostridia bacterium]|nr:phage head morphogenesis protein [Clostridia bacterium]
MSEKNIIDTAINNLLQDRELRGGSINFANWMSQLAFNTCQYCVEQHGKIVDVSVLKNKKSVNAHKNCQCEYVPMRAKQVGTATDWGREGADAYLAYFGRLPDYYVSFEAAEDAGWRSKKGNLDKVLPGNMIGGAIYKNRDGKLPQFSGRVWYEADINYGGGYRNRQRILYSNDGLMFVSYDHYQTFYEITN